MTTINLSTTTLNDYTVEDLKTIKAAALQHAKDAAKKVDSIASRCYTVYS